jgi:hypothetical protein
MVSAGVTNGKHLLVGRAEMVSRSQRISTSYSCNDPCPPFYGGSIDPFPPPVVFVNATGQATMKETALLRLRLSIWSVFRLRKLVAVCCYRGSRSDVRSDDDYDR